MNYSSEVVAIPEPEGNWSTAYEGRDTRHLVEIELAKQVVRHRRQRARYRRWPEPTEMDMMEYAAVEQRVQINFGSPLFFSSRAGSAYGRAEVGYMSGPWRRCP